MFKKYKTSAIVFVVIALLAVGAGVLWVYTNEPSTVRMLPSPSAPTASPARPESKARETPP